MLTQRLQELIDMKKQSKTRETEEKLRGKKWYAQKAKADEKLEH